jgi:alkanesulfonate monooxygenase SsuD/methylene tetrahydromethanopterin reductase-like flavin-dependent oxidoreductase (luciferase family)
LFGLDLADYERLFSEKLDLMSHLLAEQAVTWEGTVRAALHEQQVYPKTDGGHIQTWIGVGGSPESVVRAAQYGFPLVLAIIGGDPARFSPYVDLYRRALDHFSQESLPVAVHSPGFIAETDAEAVEVAWPHYQAMVTRIGRERGWPPMTREKFDAEVSHGALFVGSPETVARKIARTVRTLNVNRFDLKYSNGTLPHERLMTTIELYGREVIPQVRQLLASDLSRDVVATAA